MSNTYRSFNVTGTGGGGSNTPYSTTFVVANWSLNVDVYEIEVLESVHSKGANVLVQVYELVSGDYREVEADVEISATGDVKIIISSSPDLRFDGKIIIIGE